MPDFAFCVSALVFTWRQWEVPSLRRNFKNKQSLGREQGGIAGESVFFVQCVGECVVFEEREKNVFGRDQSEENRKYGDLGLVLFWIGVGAK